MVVRTTGLNIITPALRAVDSRARFMVDSRFEVTCLGEENMTGSIQRRFLLAATCGAAAFIGALPHVFAASNDADARGMSAEHARVVEHWTPARRAAAIPRELRIDRATGQGVLRQADGSFAPYGRLVADGAGSMTPNAKPGGGGGGGDSTPPSISNMNPVNGATIGASYAFQATVSDASGLRAVKFYVRKGSGAAQSFSASTSGNNVWTVSLSGFTDGDWSWWVTATDKANLSSTSSTLAFTVATGGGGSGGGTDVVANDPWTFEGEVQSAAGRIYFEMPSNARRTRWAGYVCSGTVVEDGLTGRSIIITAAHCVYDDANKAFARKVLFIPDQDGTTGSGTDLNCGNDPYGCWTPAFGVVDVDWTTRSFPNNVEWDYAYYVVADSGAHQPPSGGGVPPTLDSAVATLPVSFVAPAVNLATDGKNAADYTYGLGYSYSDDPNFMYCAENMGTEGTANWWLPSCGLSGGSSGGPWLQGMGYTNNGAPTGTGVIMSVNSWGYTDRPGMAGPKLSGTSALCMLDEAKQTPLSGVVPTTDGDAGVKSACN